MKYTRVLLFFFFCCYVFLGAGCSVLAPQKDFSKFYTFCAYDSSEKIPDPSGARPVIINLTVGEIPSYADCPYVVTMSNHGQLILSGIARWAEPLQDACTRALTHKLSEFMGDHVTVIPSTYTRGNTFFCDFLLSIGISDFICNEPEKKVVLDCTWSLFNLASRRQVLIRRHIKLTPYDGSNYEDIIAAMELALCGLAWDIAEKIGQICPGAAFVEQGGIGKSQADGS
ncbi:MAG: PqiC family protein [Puniceicoccales bacterium]|jgi:uncharacterized lipoprotein YmbA|nr:PqiC family protein [Puniceicoccales bacterium]